MDLIIDRSRWLNGKDPGFSFLLRKADVKMCCLGFYGLACGVPREELLGRTSPADIFPADNPSQSWPSWLFDLNRGGAINSDHCQKLMEINDEPALSDAEREAKIAELFAQHGVNVTFTGSYSEANDV